MFNNNNNGSDTLKTIIFIHDNVLYTVSNGIDFDMII